MIELDNNNHSVFALYYHVVFVIKYRRKVINDDISNRLKAIFEYIQLKYNKQCRNGTIMKIMFIYYSKHNLIVRYQNS